MKQCKWLLMLHFILWIILISVENTGTTCVLPSVLANSVWKYIQNGTTEQATFGKSTMAGFGVNVRGNELKDFQCISNTTDVYVLKSDGTYSDRGRDRRIYICMKVTKVTGNLVYLYFLSDLDSTVIPPSRIYSPLPDKVPADDQSTCSYCNYTQPPKAEEYFLLKRENTDEKLTMRPKPCLPCEADCTKDQDAKSKELSPVVTIIIVIVVIIILIVILVIIGRLVMHRRQNLLARSTMSY